MDNTRLQKFSSYTRIWLEYMSIFKSPESFLIIYISIFKNKRTQIRIFFKVKCYCTDLISDILCIGMVPKNYQPILNINYKLYFLTPFKTFLKMLSRNFNVFFVKNNEKKGSFVVCLIFFLHFLKNFSLPENEESTLFFCKLKGLVL